MPTTKIDLSQLALPEDYIAEPRTPLPTIRPHCPSHPFSLDLPCSPSYGYPLCPFHWVSHLCVVRPTSDSAPHRGLSARCTTGEAACQRNGHRPRTLVAGSSISLPSVYAFSSALEFHDRSSRRPLRQYQLQMVLGTNTVDATDEAPHVFLHTSLRLRLSIRERKQDNLGLVGMIKDRSNTGTK